MGGGLILFLIVLLLLAALSHQTFLIGLLYFFAGALILGRFWTGQVVKKMAVLRKLDHQAFPGEVIPVNLEIWNSSLLPAVWLKIQDYYPIEVAESSSFSQIISLGPHERTHLSYSLRANKRGYYRIGPIHLSSGDLFGLSAERQSEGAYDHLIVYPRIVPLTKVRIPTRSPLGSLPHPQPIFEDPSRLMGKRDYQPGDSIRRIDWKSSAATGQLQTKLFEPSIALESVIFLNLNQEDYYLRSRGEATELAIIVSASIANWMIAQRQAVGMVVNGIDPYSQESIPTPIPVKKGRSHLMKILETLARIRAFDLGSFSAVFRNHRTHYPWGTSVVVITGYPSDALFDELLLAKRAGLNLFLILCGENPESHQVILKANFYSIPAVAIHDEKDMDLWRV